LIEVLDGLKPGERIVTKGGLFIDQVATPATS
jgi:preprotein translocase subunit YajC